MCLKKIFQTRVQRLKTIFSRRARELIPAIVFLDTLNKKSVERYFFILRIFSGKNENVSPDGRVVPKPDIWRISLAFPY